MSALAERIERLAIILGPPVSHECEHDLQSILADVREITDFLAELVEADKQAVAELIACGFPPDMEGPAMALANKAAAILTKTGAIK